MEVKKWLEISKSGTVKVFAKKPPAKPNKVAMNLKITLPDELFLRPILEATVLVPDGTELVYPILTETEVIDVEEQLSTATGFKVEVSVKREDKEDET